MHRHKIISCIIFAFVTALIGVFAYLITTHFLASKKPVFKVQKFKPLLPKQDKNIQKPDKNKKIKVKSQLSKKFKKSSKTVIKPISPTPPPKILVIQQKKKVTVSNSKSNVFDVYSQAFLQKALNDLQIMNWKESVMLIYENSVAKLQSFHPKPKWNEEVFPKLFIQAVAKKIDFVDLKFTFAFFHTNNQVVIKIAFAEKPHIFIVKRYQINTQKN